MRTIIYVDGYNLFYSLLSKSSFKWLDLINLFENELLRNILLPNTKKQAEFDLIKLKFFTAPILGRFATDPKSPDRQAHYHRALKTHCGDRLEIIQGFHLPAITTGYPVQGTDHDRLNVSVMEEKQTDVNIGLHMYRDSVRDNCDAIVLCSNDSDLEPAMRMIRTDFPDMTLGLVLPRGSSNPRARRAGRLERHAHWVRHQINSSELAASLLPGILQDRRGRTIRCPDAW